MLTTVDNVKKYLNIDNDDDFIKLMIKAAQSTIENYCNRKFEINEYVEEVHIVKNKIFTKQYPITEITEILIDGNETKSYKLLPTYIILNDKVQTLTGGYANQDSRDKIAIVTYTAGFEAMDIPFDISYACIKLAAFYYKEAREDRLGVTSEKIDVLSSNYVTDIPQSIISLISGYRKVNV